MTDSTARAEATMADKARELAFLTNRGYSPEYLPKTFRELRELLATYAQSRSPIVQGTDSQIAEEALRELIAAATLVINNRQMTAYSRKSADLLRKACAQAKEALDAIEKQRRGE